jgi:hypothetical protein
LGDSGFLLNREDLTDSDQIRPYTCKNYGAANANSNQEYFRGGSSKGFLRNNKIDKYKNTSSFGAA